LVEEDEGMNDPHNSMWVPVASIALAGLLTSTNAMGWKPLEVAADPLVRMPGTQPADGIAIAKPDSCLVCHGGYDEAIEPSHSWKGSMMGQAMRDPLFWAAATVAAQDSIWLTGTPNAADLCFRCHSPAGWLGGRSDPPNGSSLSGADYDGISCDACHRMYDPFFEQSASGGRESADWVGYWDEANSTPSAAGASATLVADRAEAAGLKLFNGKAMFGANHQPSFAFWLENGGGQYFVSSVAEQRGPFADAAPPHAKKYSRFNKSLYFCNACHDVSNPVLVNLDFAKKAPGDSVTELPSEQQPAYGYGHLERTFSEFMISDYALPGGTAGLGYFAPGIFATSRPDNTIASCQDCHMADTSGKASALSAAVDRPDGSIEHPNSGLPRHELVGGNAWVPRLLASVVEDSPNYDATNAALLNRGPDKLTLDLSQGVALDAQALLRAADKAVESLRRAAAITSLAHDAGSGKLSFRIENHTGHKLISGFPEGRRMFVNIRGFKSGKLRTEINPYDAAAATLRGLDPKRAPSSPALGSNEKHLDELVYEVSLSSSLTKESHTFHMALATHRYKDNRIPPKGMRIAEAAARKVEPVLAGAPKPELFTAAEYAGGYDDIEVDLPGVDGVEVRLYYQTTSREFVEFLRDEIKGSAKTLRVPTPSGERKAYIAQSDPFFSKLAAWGDVIFELWNHNKDAPGAAPIMMTYAATGSVPPLCTQPGSDGQPCDDGNRCTTADVCTAGSCAGPTKIACIASDACHVAGSCQPGSGCIHPNAKDGTTCPGGSCRAGVCEPGEMTMTSSAGGSAGRAEPATSGGGCGCRLAQQPIGQRSLWLLWLIGLAAAARRT